MLCRPEGLAKRANCTRNVCVPFAPVVEISPEGEMEMAVVPAGIGWKPPCNTRPSLVVMRPSAEVFNPPSRVKPLVPSGNCTSKKPSPWIATSSRSPVWVSSPLVKIFEVATSREPWPIWTPVGNWLPPPWSAPGARVV